MITPLEIENKEFSKAVRGYKAEEVDEFLDEIILDLQALLAEREQLKAQVEKLNQDLVQYKKSESSVINTLESAKKLMNDISESAEKRAEIIIRNAQMDAESIQREARDSVSKLTEEGEKLAVKVSRFRERYRQLLEDELNQLEGSSEDLFADLEAEFMPASMADTPKAERPRSAAASAPEARATAPVRGEVTRRESEAGRRDTVVYQEPQRHGASFDREESPRREASFDRGEGPKRGVSSDTVVLDRSLEDILREDFGVADSGSSDMDKTRVISGDDLAKTRVIDWNHK